MIDNFLITPLGIINTPGGNVMHGMKESDSGFSGFSEAYFSEIDFGAIKAWKRHKEMTLNLVVPVGLNIPSNKYRSIKGFVKLN